MRSDEIYSEKLAFVWGRVAIAIMFSLSLLFAYLFWSQREHGPIGDSPAPDAFFLAMFALYFVLGFVLLNFQTLRVSAGAEELEVSYGRLVYRIPWERISTAELDERKGLLAYGGFGIRIASREGGAILVYNINGAPVIRLRQRTGCFPYFAFSSRRPQELLPLIHSRMRKAG